MRIAYGNLIDDINSANVVASSEDSNYPAANVQEQRLAVKWLADSATAQTITFDLGSAQSVQTLAVVSHNISSAATIVAYGNSADIWTAPTVIESLTWNEDIIMKFTSLYSQQFWRFSFSGLTEALEVGRIWIGPYVTIDPSSTQDFTVDVKNNDIVTFGKDRQKYASPGIQWREISLSFPPSYTSVTTVIRTFYESVGKHDSFIFANFDSLRTYPLVDPLYGSLSGDMEFKHQTRQRYSYDLKIVENR